LSIDDYAEGGRLTVLLTGGRAPCTLALARLFHVAGHRVLVAESVKHHLCRVSKAVERSFRVPPPNGEPGAFAAALAEIIVAEQVDVLIPTCEEIFFVALGLDRLAPLCRVWASPIGQLQELHDKWRFARLAERLGLAVPETRLVASGEDWLALAGAGRVGEAGELAEAGESQGSMENRKPGVADAAEEWLGGRLVLKPAYSRFASQVLFLGAADDAGERLRTLMDKQPVLSAATPWVAQRMVEGRHLCTYSIAYEGVLIAHAAYPCLYRVGVGATVHYEPMRHEGALAWVRRFVAGTGFTGQIAFDFIEAQGNGGEAGVLYALECNPRATSGIHLFEGKDGSGQMAAAASGGGRGLTAAFLQPRALADSGILLTPGSGAGSAMLSAPMLACGLRDIHRTGGLRSWWRAWRSARDAVYRRADRRPALEQLRVLRDAQRTARANGITLTQATTIDLEWNGEA